MTQVSLATRANVDPSIISRILSNKRAPTIDVLQNVAMALGIDVADLVAGTDAQEELTKLVDRIPLSDYKALLAKLVEFESKARDAEARVEQLRATMAEEKRAKDAAVLVAKEATAKALKAEAKQLAAEDRERTSQRESNRKLAAAAEQVSRLSRAYEDLRTRVIQLQAELARTERSANYGAIVASVSAAASVATLGLLFGGDDDDEA